MDKQSRGASGLLCFWIPFPRPPMRSPTTIPSFTFPFHNVILATVIHDAITHHTLVIVNYRWWKCLQDSKQDDWVRECRLVRIVSEVIEIK